MDRAETATVDEMLKGLEIPLGFSVGLYSLDAGATQRARGLLEAQFPGIKVIESHDKVATDPLGSMASSVDLMVVAVASAKHAATIAINVARGSKPLARAAGKGSSSLVRAVIEYLEARPQAA